MPRISLAALLAGATFAMSLTTVHAATTISGTLTAKAIINQYWKFVPTATDTDNRPITFSIQNKPEWATFQTSSGALSGKPYSWDAWSVYRNIIITASDGLSSASITFAMEVIPTATSSPIYTVNLTGTSSGSGSSGGSGGTTTGAATLSWTPPTLNTNGTTLTNLAGYIVNYGTSAGNLTSSIKLANPGLSSYVVESLSAGTYYFAVSAYTSSGTSSVLSKVVSKTIP